jgi:hypothetical protein
MTSTQTTPAFVAARRLYLYALVLAVLGLAGYGLAVVQASAPPVSPTEAAAEANGAASAADEAEAAGPSLTPLIFTLGPALLTLLAGWMSSRLEVSRAIGMIGIHVGMLLPLLFGVAYAVVGWGRFTRWQAGESPLANVLLFAALVLASVTAAVAVIKARPPKASRIAA